jgi:hypothetical protein
MTTAALAVASERPGRARARRCGWQGGGARGNQGFPREDERSGEAASYVDGEAASYVDGQ